MIKYTIFIQTKSILYHETKQGKRIPENHLWQRQSHDHKGTDKTNDGIGNNRSQKAKEIWRINQF